MTDAPRVSIIGCGAMGSTIGARLLETGCVLTAYDRNPPKVAALADKGATAAASPAQAAADADFVITSLNAATAVRDVVFGAGGAASTLRRGGMVIDMSTIDPASTRALAADAEALGLRWLDCPLSGGAPKALTGTLTVMAGGTAEDFEASRVVMDRLCANYTLMGPSGAGQATKLINQVLCALGFVAVAEATQLALDAGVDAEKIPQALKGGRADSAILQEYMPRFAVKDYRRTGRLDNMVKDLNFVQDLARQTGTAMPMTALCAEIHRLMTAAGWGGEDQAVLREFFTGAGQGPKT
jgi:2-hydroxy-3-oxopropionate reductase